MEDLLSWIESHQTVVDLLKWTIIVLLGWLTGFFKFILKKIKSPKVHIVAEQSRAFFINKSTPEHDGIQMGLMLKASVENPTNEKVVLREFRVAYKTQKTPWSYSKWYHCISYPHPPQYHVGSKVINQAVFFSNFPPEVLCTTLDGKIDSKDFQEGYILATSFTWGALNPRINKNHLRVRVQARFTDTKVRTISSKVKALPSFDVFENYVPGIKSHLEDSIVWNVTVQ